MCGQPVGVRPPGKKTSRWAQCRSNHDVQLTARYTAPLMGTLNCTRHPASTQSPAPTTPTRTQHLTTHVHCSTLLLHIYAAPLPCSPNNAVKSRHVSQAAMTSACLSSCKALQAPRCQITLSPSMANGNSNTGCCPSARSLQHTKANSTHV